MNTSIKTIAGLAMSAVLAFGLFACDNASSPSSDAPAIFEIRMHDTPVDNIAEVNVHVESVRVNHSDGNGWVTINEPNEVYNLLDLVNGNMVVLGEEEVEGGRYNQVRLVLGENNTIVTNDGEVHDLQTPSAQQSGLKININADLEPGVRYTLNLDFDVSKSIVQTGNSGYILKPVIRAYEEAVTGTIAGTVVPSEANARIEAIVADTVYTSTFTNEGGEFLLIGLEPQTYNLVISATEGGFEDAFVNDLDVEAGERTDAGVIELEESNGNGEE